MTFSLSIRSHEKLKGVHPDLVAVVEKAIKLSKVDFMVTEGLRTAERQKQLVAEGKSQTLDSKHIQGKAVDVAAWVKGKVSWDLPLYLDIAEAFREASLQLRVPLRSGLTWQLVNQEQTIKQQHDHYVSRKKAAGQRPFIDGPHWELP